MKCKKEVNRKSLLKWLRKQKKLAGCSVNMKCDMSSYHKGKKDTYQQLIDMLMSDRFRL